MPAPLSVDDILLKQKAEKEAASKPKFLTKEQRAALALEKRNAEVKQQQQREDQDRESRVQLEKAVEGERRRDDGRYGGGGPNGYQNGGHSNGHGYGQSNGMPLSCPGHRGLVGAGITDNIGQQGRYDRFEARGGRNGYSHDQHGRDGRYSNANGNGAYGGNAGNANGHGHHHGHSNGVSTPPIGPRGHGPPTGPRGMMGAPPVPSPLASGSSTPASQQHSSGAAAAIAPTDAVMPTDTELLSIRARYLGLKSDRKPRQRKAQDNKKINFDWNADDDTTANDQGTWSSELKGKGPGGTMLGGRQVGYGERPVTEGEK
jgi:ATP-dependent RNA helicase DDX23/PRP28